MSVNKQNFPVTGQGDRRTEETQKELLARLPKQTHIAVSAAPLPLNIGHNPNAFQVTKTLTRQIAPAPGGQLLGGIKPVAGHQVTGLNTAVHKKVTEMQKLPISLPCTAVGTSIQTGVNVSTIIPVHISSSVAAGASPSSNPLHVPNVSSIVRQATMPGGIHHPTQFSPRGVVAASAQVRTGSTINIQRQALPSALQAGLNLPGQIRNVLPPQMMRPGTPPTNRTASPAVSHGTGQPGEAHRATSISLHNITTTVGSPSIQITLQAPRTQADGVGKTTTTFQAGKVHQAINMTAQPKVVMTHSLTPVLQHPTLAAKGNRGQPMSNIPLSSVTVASSLTTVTIPIMTSGTTTTTIPIAKVPPQRQHQAQSHVITSVAATSHVAEHRAEPTSFPQPQPAHAHSTPLSQVQGHIPSASQIQQLQGQGHTQQGHSQASSLFIQQYRSSPVVSTVATASSVSHSTDASRPTSVAVPAVFPPYLMDPDNPYFTNLVRCHVAQQQASSTSSTIAASLQAAVGQAVSQQAPGSNVRFHNQLMVMQDSVRPSSTSHTAVPPVSSHGQHVHHTTEVTAAKSVTAVSTAAPVTMVTRANMGDVALVASSLFTAAAQNLHVPQIAQAAPNTPSATPINNPSASPRPSILRKRTNEGVSAVKKQLAMTSSSEVHSPRFDNRVDSTPQSNMSSPKTPASGESQSSTDTALSSEATTPTQIHADGKIKQEHDLQENGYTNNTPEASPRKRRKQLLQATEELKDLPVNVFDKLVEACVKQEVMDEEEELENDLDHLDDDNLNHQIREEYVDDEGIRWTLEKCRPGVGLLHFYNISWKPKNNHFNRYTDVKAKDERRPTVNELSNQKGVVQKASGWKLYHMAAQIEDLVELERELHSKLSSIQAAVGPEPPLRHSLMEDESGMIHELTQGNIQRCKLLTDQLNDAKSQMLKVLDHKPKISEIVTKHMSKRPIKKKERT